MVNKHRSRLRAVGSAPQMPSEPRAQSPERLLTFAHSPDPDDAYMFYGFETGAAAIPRHTVRHHLEDIQSLNERAFRGEFEITAVSAHAYAHLSDRYWVLSCGASVGRGYGPTLVRKQTNPSPGFQPPSPSGRGMKGEGLQNVRIAVPGKWTTAALVLDLWLAEQKIQIKKTILPFDKILSAVQSGEVDAGLIIHEGQLTYEQEGFEKIWNAGEWWGKRTGLPLPLGLDVVRKDLGLPLARQISTAFRASIEYANKNHDQAVDYALQYGRGLDTELGKRFIGMYVNEDTLSQGQEVQKGLRELYDQAFRHKLIPQSPDLTFI